MVRTCEGFKNWYLTAVALVDTVVPVRECTEKLDNLQYKDDPSARVCGVAHSNLYLYNLKATDSEKYRSHSLSSDKPIFITYNRFTKKVKFQSETFDLY